MTAPNGSISSPRTFHSLESIDKIDQLRPWFAA
jgi:hypothetical protein